LARTLGGTVGIGLCGALVNARMERSAGMIGGILNIGNQGGILETLERLLRPELMAEIPASVQLALRETVADGVGSAYRAVVVAAVICLLICWRLPGANGIQSSS
jgi:hypothetical protein